MKKNQLKLPSVSNIIFCILIVFSILAAVSSTGGRKLNFLGYRPVLVVSGSMLPSIQINSLSIMKYCSIDEIEVGDVVMYYHPRMQINITHRAIEKYEAEEEPAYLIVKGDANSSSDDIHVTDDMLVGKLIATYNQTVPFVNLIILDGNINKPMLLVMMITLAMLLTIISLIISWVINIIAIVILILTKHWSIEWYETGVADLEIQSKWLDAANNSINRQSGDSAFDILAKIILALQINKMVATSQDIKESYKIIRVFAGKELRASLKLDTTKNDNSAGSQENYEDK